MSNAQPTISIVLEGAGHLGDVAKWAELATGLGVPSSSPVDVAYNRLTVTAYIGQTEVPE